MAEGKTYSARIGHLEELREVARELLCSYGEERFFAFFGKMGVGKTTLIKEMCEELGSEDVVCSPTFAIVNEYATGEGRPIYHFDFYRLKNEEEAYDIGYEEYFYSGEYCFTEWTEKVEGLLPERYVRVSLREENGERFLESWLVVNGFALASKAFPGLGIQTS